MCVDARTLDLVRLQVTTLEAKTVLVKVLAASASVILSEQLKLTPLIFLAVCKVVAVVALPVNAPIMDVAVKVVILPSVPPMVEFPVTLIPQLKTVRLAGRLSAPKREYLTMGVTEDAPAPVNV